MTMETIGANVFVETVYPGVNVGCIVGDEIAICIDTPMLPGEAQRWMTLIRSWGAEFARYVVYTNGQSERVLGTQYLICGKETPRVESILSSRQTSRHRRLPFQQSAMPMTPKPGRGGGGGTVVAHRLAWVQVKEICTDSFKQSMVDTYGDRDPDMVNLEVILPQITFDEQIKLYANDLTITLLGAASGALWVWLPEQRVLFVGDMVVAGTHPPLSFFDIHEWLLALDRLRQEPQFQDATLVSGRGPLCDASATEPLTDYLRLVCDKTQRVFRAGRPKAELNGVAAELVSLYPVPNGHRERVQRQIKLALDDLYDDLKATDAASE
jgi:hypothetical protein